MARPQAPQLARSNPTDPSGIDVQVCSKVSSRTRSASAGWPAVAEILGDAIGRQQIVLEDQSMALAARDESAPRSRWLWKQA